MPTNKKNFATYETSLFDIQNIADAKGVKYPQLAHLLPSDAQIHDVDLESRKINIPDVLSVQYDHNAEIIYFRCPRYYDNMDLTNTVCIIQYINADGKAGLYWVPWYDTAHYIKDPEDPAIETPVILVPWAVGGLATVSPGTLTFNIRFYKIADDGKTFLYNLSTQAASGRILHGMEFSKEDFEKFQLGTETINQIYQDLDMVKQDATTYWEDV